jgi:hypothetical protein
MREVEERSSHHTTVRVGASIDQVQAFGTQVSKSWALACFLVFGIHQACHEVHASIFCLLLRVRERDAGLCLIVGVVDEAIIICYRLAPKSFE